MLDVHGEIDRLCRAVDRDPRGHAPMSLLETLMLLLTAESRFNDSAAETVDDDSTSNEDWFYALGAGSLSHAQCALSLALEEMIAQIYADRTAGRY